jgi:hypothetical protein
MDVGKVAIFSFMMAPILSGRRREKLRNIWVVVINAAERPPPQKETSIGGEINTADQASFKESLNNPSIPSSLDLG